MTEYKQDLYHKAQIAKSKLVCGQITLKEAKEQAQPYINYVNQYAKEKAKEFGVRPRLVNVSSFLRY